MYIFSFHLVFKFYKSILKIMHIISDHLIFFGTVNIRGYLVVAFFKCFHILDMDNVSFECYYHWHSEKSNFYLLLLAIFHGLEMKQFWSVNYIFLVYKSKVLFWTCPVQNFGQHLWEICIHCIAVFFGTFWRLCFFEEKFLEILKQYFLNLKISRRRQDYAQFYSKFNAQSDELTPNFQKSEEVVKNMKKINSSLKT